MSRCCKELLSEGLDLCVRARKLDRSLTDALDAGSVGKERPLQGSGTRSLTPALWVLDQYDSDVEDWEQRARRHLMQGCSPAPESEGGADASR